MWQEEGTARYGWGWSNEKAEEEENVSSFGDCHGSAGLKSAFGVAQPAMKTTATLRDLDESPSTTTTTALFTPRTASGSNQPANALWDLNDFASQIPTPIPPAPKNKSTTTQQTTNLKTLCDLDGFTYPSHFPPLLHLTSSHPKYRALPPCQTAITKIKQTTRRLPTNTKLEIKQTTRSTHQTTISILPGKNIQDSRGW